jgi:hypothetical protein
MAIRSHDCSPARLINALPAIMQSSAGNCDSLIRWGNRQDCQITNTIRVWENRLGYGLRRTNRPVNAAVQARLNDRIMSFRHPRKMRPRQLAALPNSDLGGSVEDLLFWTSRSKSHRTISLHLGEARLLKTVGVVLPASR